MITSMIASLPRPLSRHHGTSVWALLLFGVAGAASSMVSGCGTPQAPRPSQSAPPPLAAAPPVSMERPDEWHLSGLRQLTLAGENAEAYWSPNGIELIFQSRPQSSPQARPVSGGCDRIYRMNVLDPAPQPPVVPVSSGAGATTCSFFLSGTSDVIFSSTHLAGAECPPRPDQRQGYVWALHQGYDIFRAAQDGSHLRRLTATPGYDAEATVCQVDGSIVFTSVRDGDLDLYRMDGDGGNVRRLTNRIGYDGGAFFDGDCSHIVWRASRPAPGAERDEYQRMLGQGLVRPTKLELWVAEADGSNAMQVTYLDAASVAPSFFPGQPRIIFSSNVGDPRGLEFDLWSVDANGTNLERVTTAPGFDGFPMFTADGRHLAFSSNRATAPGHHDTNLFVADWKEGVVRRSAETPADRILGDIRWLADPARAGRGMGTPGLESSGTFIEARLQRLGLAPAGEGGTFRQRFQVPTEVKMGPNTSLTLGGQQVPSDALTVASYSASGTAGGPLVLAGYGIEEPSLGIRDYAGLDVRGKIVVVRRFAPDLPAPLTLDAEQQRRTGDVRRKATIAREKGARALLVVDAPLPPSGQERRSWKMPAEALPPGPRAQGYGDAGLPVLFVRRGAFAATLARLERRGRVLAALRVSLALTETAAFNVVARVAAGAPESERRSGAVVVGAHYDHLGMGERHSLAPDSRQPHLGADDNASGVGTLIEVARILAAHRHTLARDVVVVAFSGEEEGTLGSAAFVRAPPPPLQTRDVVAMVNLDMVGHLRDNRVTVLGRGSAEEWPALLEVACGSAHLDCGVGEGGGAGAGAGGAGVDGYGPSDQMPFYVAGIPVTHFFTGSHPDYHRPSDTADKINAAGAGQIALATAALIEAVASRPDHLTPHHP